LRRTQIEVDQRKRLVERITASRYISKSARLRSLLVYLCDQVLENNAQEIHEQQVGHAVFGRPANYDTISDNIVRVHASMLRKRLEQYFSSEGRDETVIIELPKGNYAPLFVERPKVDPVPALEPVVQMFASPPAASKPANHRAWTGWLIVGVAIVVLAVTVAFVLRGNSGSGSTPGRYGLWSKIFASGAHTDVVLDDQGVGLYEELTGTQVALSDYFNRNYLRGLGEIKSKQRLDQADAGSIVLKRQSSYASAFLLWKLGAIAADAHGSASVHFARDYSLRELQTNSAVLIGNSVSNPWIEAFHDRTGLSWKYDASRGAYYPVDSWAKSSDSRDQFRVSGDGYASVALLPNLSGTGTVLILSTSGGSAMNAASEFLADNECVRRLTSLLPHDQLTPIYYEALLRVKSRSRLTRDTAIVICRKLRT
jgi:hypothetical protein